MPFNVATLAHLARAIALGEITVMMLAKEINGMAVLDEVAGRREAKKLDLRYTGTLGLLHQGLQRNWLNETEGLARVVKLCGAGFFIPRPPPGQTFTDYFRSIQ